MWIQVLSENFPDNNACDNNEVNGAAYAAHVQARTHKFPTMTMFTYLR